MMQIINSVKDALNDEEIKVIKTFLSLKFPETLEELAFDNVEIIELLSTPYDELKMILINHLDLLGKDDMIHLNEIAEFYWQDENAFQTMHSIISKISKNISSPAELDPKLRIEIWEEMDTIKKTTSSKTKTSKESGIKSLDELEQLYENYPQHRDFIVAELKRLPEQIKFLAPDYCGEQGENSAMELTPFKMMVRGIKLN
ncbi:MAG: hypothetical protein WCO66_00205 [Candidatus Absconditabacteria bacterium]